MSKRGWRVYHRPDDRERAAVPASLLILAGLALAAAGYALAAIRHGGF